MDGRERWDEVRWQAVRHMGKTGEAEAEDFLRLSRDYVEALMSCPVALAVTRRVRRYDMSTVSLKT